MDHELRAAPCEDKTRREVASMRYDDYAAEEAEKQVEEREKKGERASGVF